MGQRRIIGPMPAGRDNRSAMPSRREALLWGLAGAAIALAVILGLLLSG
jgi:predicted cobalt transporter CbtA